MDPISQGVVGAIAAGCGAKRNNIKPALFTGLVAGMLADLDVLIFSPNDPLLTIQYHRHFTHSLVFIPFGALIAAALLFFVFRRKRGFGELYLFSFLGYSTAGLLDACTSYGTHLLWPFSDDRTAWSIIAIIDPFFTVPLLLFLFVAFRRSAPIWVKLGLVFGLFYLGLGYLQKQRVVGIQQRLASSRGQSVVQSYVKPTVLNQILWRSVYRSKDQFHVDAIRVGFFGGEKVYPGVSVPIISPKEHQELRKLLRDSSAQLHDMQRFRNFSEDFVYIFNEQPLMIGDLRYSFLPNSIKPIWVIQLHPDTPQRHVDWVVSRDITKERFEKFQTMLLGNELKQ